MAINQPRAWTDAELTALALRKVHDAIQAGHGEYAKTMTRELCRLSLRTTDQENSSGGPDE